MNERAAAAAAGLNSKSDKSQPTVSRKPQSLKRKPDTSQQTTQQPKTSSTLEHQSSIDSPPSRRRTEPSPGLPQPRRSARPRSLSPCKPAETGVSSKDSKKKPQGHPREAHSIPQVEEPDELDSGEPPSQYQIGGLKSVHLHHSREFEYPDGVRRDDLDIEYPLPSNTEMRTHTRRTHHKSPSKEKGGGLVQMVTAKMSSIFHSNPLSSSPEDNSTPRIHESGNYAESPRREHHGRQVARKQTSAHQNDPARTQHDFQNILDRRELEWKEKEEKLQSDNLQLVNGLRKRVDFLEGESREWKSKLRQVESEKQRVQDDHNTFIRKQQEASFRQMESARWLPKEENKVRADLDRLKTSMRHWAKATSIKEILRLQSLEASESAEFVEVSAQVVALENQQLPLALLTTTRASVLLLNALLAHNVYASFFHTPFFFFDNNGSEGQLLEGIYQLAKQGNQADAHLWRSQTLRLLMPPLLNETSDGERDLRTRIESLVTNAADLHAKNFLAGPARHLIDTKSRTDFTSKLSKIYHEAANMAYMLWTRRTEMRCVFLHEMANPTFDAESPFFDPDSLVRYDDHEDGLRGRPVTIMVHPLLEVYGTEEAKDYDKGRVWAKGVVWLDSRKH